MPTGEASLHRAVYYYLFVSSDAHSVGTPDMARVHSNKEVSRHSSPRDAWVMVDGHVCDVSGFLHSHPGGLDVLDGRLGTDISDALRSPDFHRHSSTAFQILEQCRIGVLEGAQPHVRTYVCLL